MGRPRQNEWWRGCVIYQIYPRSFQDTTGDGSGDLQGITSRLGHVASLGVDATNPNQALHLYESCGFRVVSSSTAYRKPVLREALEEVRR